MGTFVIFICQGFANKTRFYANPGQKYTTVGTTIALLLMNRNQFFEFRLCVYYFICWPLFKTGTGGVYKGRYSICLNVIMLSQHLIYVIHVRV